MKMMSDYENALAGSLVLALQEDINGALRDEWRREGYRLVDCDGYSYRDAAKKVIEDHYATVGKEFQLCLLSGILGKTYSTFCLNKVFY